MINDYYYDNTYNKGNDNKNKWMTNNDNTSTN